MKLTQSKDQKFCVSLCKPSDCPRLHDTNARFYSEYSVLSVISQRGLVESESRGGIHQTFFREIRSHRCIQPAAPFPTLVWRSHLGREGGTTSNGPFAVDSKARSPLARSVIYWGYGSTDGRSVARGLSLETELISGGNQLFYLQFVFLKAAKIHTVPVHVRTTGSGGGYLCRSSFPAAGYGEAPVPVIWQEESLPLSQLTPYHFILSSVVLVFWCDRRHRLNTTPPPKFPSLPSLRAIDRNDTDDRKRTT